MMETDGENSIHNQLIAALEEVGTIDKLLTECEAANGDSKLLSEITTNMKKVTAQLRELSANPKCKAKENVSLFQQLSDKMKDLVKRTKNLHEIKARRSTRSNSGSSKRLAPKILQGYLQKQGEDLLKGWKLRYFKQNGNRLFYFQNETDPEAKVFQTTNPHSFVSHSILFIPIILSRDSSI